MIGRIVSKIASLYYSKKITDRYLNGSGKEAHDYIERMHVPPLSAEDKNQIDRYWAQYGVKLDDYCWHQMYYSITGKKDPRFIPHNFLDTVVTPFYNDRSIVRMWTDKNYFHDVICKGRFYPSITS